MNTEELQLLKSHCYEVYTERITGFVLLTGMTLEPEYYKSLRFEYFPFICRYNYAVYPDGLAVFAFELMFSNN